MANIELDIEGAKSKHELFSYDLAFGKIRQKFKHFPIKEFYEVFAHYLIRKRAFIP